MNWYNAESTERPQEQDLTSSKKYNYVARNITEVEKEDEEGNTYTVYQFEKCKIPKESWGMYLDLTQAQADIEYLNMVTEEL